MSEKLGQGKSETLESRALRIIARRYKIKKPILVDRLEDQRRPTKERIFQFRAVAEKDANGPHFSVVLDEEEKEIDLDQVQEHDLTEYFSPPVVSVDITKFSPLTPAPPVKIKPTVNDLVLNQGDTSSETIAVIVPANASLPKADVYFLADTTGSMRSVINAVKAGAANILTALNGLGPDFAFGVGNYKDFPNDPYDFQHQLGPSKVAADVQNAINHWSASGGGDVPEGQLYALDKLAVPPGGTIGWRPAAKRIIVWFGDAPGHDPVCAAISGEAAGITAASATATLVNEKITVLAISTANPGLDADPENGATDYVPACGAAGGTPGQGTCIANATGGKFVAGINPATIVNTIISLVSATVASVNHVKLVPSADIAPFLATIVPPGGYGPLAGDQDHTLTFGVKFVGAIPCKSEGQVFRGTLDVVADGVVVASKRVRITVPPCPPEEFVYSIKFVCGTQAVCPCECLTVAPGHYATEINIHNLSGREVAIRKRVVPVVLAGAPVGREPASSGPRAEDGLKLPPHSATFDDCCRLSEVLFGAAGSTLSIGFLEITASADVAVTAVYTSSGLSSGGVSIDVRQITSHRR